VAGLSLVELLVAVALGAILMAGAVTLFVNNRATYEVTNDMARLQENARFALEEMTRTIRMAGHTGCVNVVGNLNNTLEGETGYAPGQLSDFGNTGARAGSNAVEGFQNGATLWLPSTYPGTGEAILAGGATYPAVAADSDGITVRYVAGDRSAVDRGVPQPPPAAPLTVRDVNNEVLNQSPDLAVPGADASPSNTVLRVRDLTWDLRPGAAAVVSDCGGGDVFVLPASGVNQDGGPTFVPTGNATDEVNATTLTRSYSAENRAIVAPLQGVRYYVRDNAAGVPTLYRSRLDPNNAFNEITEELVDGVQSLQVLYGFDGPDADRVAETYLRADETATLDGASVGLAGPDGAGRHDGVAGLVTVKIGLLMVTVDEMRKDGDLAEIYDVLDERFCNATAAAGGNGCTATYPDDGRRRRVFSTTIGVRNFQ
jgi:type IV pilus assembly protein PilW